jgi:hypothetical protein
MTFPGLVKANNLSDIGDKEKAWDNLGRNISATLLATYDPDTLIYLQNMLNVDQQLLEPEVMQAIDNFVVGCKTDGIWTAIKSCCILAGAHTLAAALVPLVGTAPTNFNFVSGDYNRKTGLLGDGSTKYLNSNRANNADPQNSSSLAVYATSINTKAPVGFYAGKGNTDADATSFGFDGQLFFRSRSIAFGRPNPLSGSHTTGLIGINRSSPTEFVARSNKSNTTLIATSTAPTNTMLWIFGTNGFDYPSNARLAFYSIGESLDLALLDTRVTTLINSIAGAVP